MKPDNFDDNVRRKLDGIEPVFREKDWAQMQQVMRHHGLITPWSAAPSWLLPAAGVVSVAALLTTTVWLGHTNGQLRQDVQRLNQTVTQLKQTPPATLPRTDTVYVTRLIPAPGNSQTNNSAIEPNLSVPQLTPTRDRTVAAQPQTDGLTSPADRNPSAGRPTVATSAPVDVKPNAARPDLNSSTDQVHPVVGATGDPKSRDEAVERPNVGTAPADAAGSRMAQTTEAGRNQNGTGTDRTRADRSVGSNRRVETVTPSATPGPTGVTASTNSRNPTGSRLTQSGVIRSDVITTPDGQSSATPSVTLERLTGKPLRLDSVNFDEGIGRAVRQLRRLYPPKVLPALPASPAAAPEATAVVTPNDRFRLGLTGELGLNQWSLGLYGDVMLGRHLLVGLGFERVDISGGAFSTDIKFFDRTQRDFRHDYARGIDKRYDIIDINRHSVTWQIPITLGYRLPLGHGIALTPGVGFSTSLMAREIVSFSYQRGPYEYQEVQLADQRPVAWYHSWSTSVGIEKRWGPLTVQASPYLVGPFTDSPLGLNGTSGGLRLRTLYSF